MCAQPANLQELSILKDDILVTLEEYLQAAQRFGQVAGNISAREIIQKLKATWCEFSKISTSLRAVHSCLGDVAAAKRLRTERKLLAARIEATVMDLNDSLRVLGEELESSFSN